MKVKVDKERFIELNIACFLHSPPPYLLLDLQKLSNVGLKALANCLSDQYQIDKGKKEVNDGSIK